LSAVPDPGPPEGPRPITRGLSGTLRRRLIEPILGIEDTPTKLARGVAVGTFVALTPTMGGQMLIALGLAWLVRANKVAAVVMVWITNPLTVVPYYYGSYRLGLLLVGETPMTYASFRRHLPGGDMGFWEAVRALFVAFGWPLLLGALAIAIAATLPIYPCALRYFRRREEQRRRARE
jgi:uncharacterized protein (DUF2062 family)